jgi:hypothetical protein
MPSSQISLTSFSIHISEFSHREEEGHKRFLYCALATDQPGIFHPDLVHSFSDFSACLPGFHHFEEAGKATEEAIRPL